MVSTNPNVRKLVQWALERYNWLKLEAGRKHWRLRSLRSHDFILIPFSPSDIRVIQHLRAQIRRLAENGVGFIAAKHWN